MKKVLLLTMLLLCFLASYGQRIGNSYNQVMDSIMQSGHIRCGVSAAYFRSLAAVNTISGGSTSYMIPGGSFPSGAIDTCGKFRVFYTDRAIGSGEGFDAPGSVGAKRRSIMCTVLNYIQSVIDFSAIPSGEYVRLFVDTSYSLYSHAPSSTRYFAYAGGKLAPGSSGLQNGMMHDYIVSGTDPASATGDYHAEMRVNFDSVFTEVEPTVYEGKKILYYESDTGMISCAIDLYSVLLHEMTHALGWGSYLEIFPSVTPAAIYSSLDTALYHSTRGTSLTTLTKHFSSGILTSSPHPGSYAIWTNGKQPPENFPVFVGYETFTGFEWATSFAHLDESVSSYTARQRNSPGDAMDYVMGPFAFYGVARRTYSKAEVQTLHDILGYSYHSSVSTSPLAINRWPWSSKMSSTAYDALYESYTSEAWHERIPADGILVNDSNSKWELTLSSDTTLKDADSDPLSIYPGSIVNFRGCGLNGNDHGSLTVSGSGTKITYRPRHNFYGRAQFGFNLFDGHEKGGFVLYTIDVKRGTNVNSNTGDNIVVNGDFEQGSEVMIRNVKEDVNNSTAKYDYHREGRLHGAHFSDGHPYDYLPWSYMPFGGGTAIKNSFANCDTLSGAITYKYGNFGTSGFPYAAQDLPLQPGDSGQRYQVLQRQTGGYYYLTNPLNGCKRYRLSFDVYQPFAGMIPNIPKQYAKVGFLSDEHFDLSTLTFYNQASPVLLDSLYPSGIPLEFSSGYWLHIDTTFRYCHDTEANMLFLTMNLNSGNFYLDNISIKEDTTTTKITIRDSVLSPCANRQLISRVENYVAFNCKDTILKGPDVFWTANGDTVSRDTIIYARPKVTTTYIAYTVDGCETYSDTITLLPVNGPTIAILDSVICYGASTHLNIACTDSAGTVTYTWDSDPDLSCLSCKSPIATPDKTKRYWFTASDASGCFRGSVLVIVRPLPEVVMIGDTVCPYLKAELKIVGEPDYLYEWSEPMMCGTCDTTFTSLSVDHDRYYAVKITNKYGCVKNDSVLVKVKDLPPILAGPKGIAICYGDSLTLSASGGTPVDYNWTMDPLVLSCMNCSNPLAKPKHPTLFNVMGKGVNGCLASDTLFVDVLSLPTVTASSSDTAICGPGYVTLTAGGASSYSWSPTFGLSSPTSSSTPAYVPATTSYVVIGTDPRGCSARDTVTVTVKTKPTITVSPTSSSVCLGDSTILTASGGITYSWSPSSGLSCTSCNPVKAAAPSSGSLTYTVTGMDAGGCSNTATASVSKGACKCVPSSVFGTVPTVLSGTISGSLSSGYYHIPASITITGAPVFTGAKILIEPGVVITVANSAKLTLDSCHLFTCPDSTMMWQGIVLQSSGSTSGTIETKNNTLIEDAVIAIDASNIKTPSSGNIVSVVATTFNRNRTGIYLYNYTPSSPSTYAINIQGSVFSARAFNDTTITGYPKKWPAPIDLITAMTPINATPSFVLTRQYGKRLLKDGTFAYAGIQARNVGYTSGVTYYGLVLGGGSSPFDKNMFDNMRYGIYSNNSNMQVKNSYFLNISKRMMPVVSGTASEGGAGIYAHYDSGYVYKSFLNVNDPTFNVALKFHDCYTGVLTRNLPELNVGGVIMTSSHVKGGTTPGADLTTDVLSGDGVRMYATSNFVKANINSNYFYNIHYGIVTQFNAIGAGCSTIINSNKMKNKDTTISASFLTGQYMALGISASQSMAPSGTATITANSNNLDSVESGIHFNLYGALQPTAANNRVWIKDLASSTTPQWGVRFTGTSNGSITGNEVKSRPLTSDYVRGVYAEKNTSLTLCNNLTRNIGRGFDFAGGTPQANTRWTYNTIDTARKGFVLGSDVGEQTFTADWSRVPFYWYYAGANIWRGVYSGTNFGTYVEGTVSYPKAINSKLHVRNIVGINAELPSNHYGAPATNRYTTTSPASLIVESSQATTSNCSGAIYPPVIKPKVFPGTPSFSLSMMILADSLGYDSTFNAHQWMGQLDMYLVNKTDSDEISSSSEYASFMANAAGSRFQWISNMDDALSIGDITTAQSILAAEPVALGRIPVDPNVTVTDYGDADYVVANYRQYYTLYLKYLSGTMSINDSLSVDTLSRKCAYANGQVIFRARAFYETLFETSRMYRDDSCAGDATMYRLTHESKLGAVSYHQGYMLFPNPNEGSFTVRQQLLNDKPVDVRIYNSVGILLQRRTVQFNAGMANFVLPNALPGIYLICITDDSKETACLKFNIH